MIKKTGAPLSPDIIQLRLWQPYDPERDEAG